MKEKVHTEMDTLQFRLWLLVMVPVIMPSIDNYLTSNRILVTVLMVVLWFGLLVRCLRFYYLINYTYPDSIVFLDSETLPEPELESDVDGEQRWRMTVE